MDEQTKTPVLKPALIYGAIVGLASVVINLIFYFIGQSFEKWAMILSSIVSIGLLVLTLILYRAEYAKTVLSYGSVVLIALLIGFFSSVLTGAYTYAIYSIDDGYLQDMKYYALDKVDERMDKMDAKYQEKLSDDQYEAFESKMDAGRKKAVKKIKDGKPITYARQTIVSSVFLALLIGLIAGIFLRRKSDHLVA